MRVALAWRPSVRLWSVTALDGRSKGKVVATADKVVLRDATFGHPAGRIFGTLDGFHGETTSAGDRSFLGCMDWCDSDRRYVRMARDHGTETHPTEGGAAMVVTARRLGKPVVYHFDPCLIPEG